MYASSREEVRPMKRNTIDTSKVMIAVILAVRD
jgi:hypothetical protein